MCMKSSHLPPDHPLGQSQPRPRTVSSQFKTFQFSFIEYVVDAKQIPKIMVKGLIITIIEEKDMGVDLHSSELYFR